jgi:hypothetical protein
VLGWLVFESVPARSKNIFPSEDTMNPPGPTALFWVFTAAWLSLGVGSTCFFYASWNARLMRAVHPWFVVFAGVLFCLFYVLLVAPGVLAFLVPVVAVICFNLIHRTKFCDACGATLPNQVGSGG